MSSLAQSPTAAELHLNPIVQAALDQAWIDSRPNDSVRRHEEGGWIYLNPATGDITIQRAAAGIQTAIDLDRPPIVEGSFIVGKFHTHPNPSVDGWDPGPSRCDQRVDSIHGVPDLVRSDQGVHYSGPDRRRGGLTGNPGYPS
jgi:hypothetical protein